MIRLFLLAMTVSLVGCKSMAREEVSEVQIITTLAKRLANYDKTISTLTKKSKKAQEELLHARYQFEDAERAVDVAQKKYDEAEKELGDFYSSTKDINWYDDHVSKAEWYRKRIRKLKKEREELRANMNNAEEMLDAKRLEIDNLREIYEQKKSYKETISSQIREVERDVEGTVEALGGTAAATVVGGALSAALLHK